MNIKNILIIFVTSLILQSCYKTQGPEYLDEQDITITGYNQSFNFNSAQTIIINDSVALRHDYLTDSQVSDFYKRNGTSDQIVTEITNQFKAKGFQVKSSITKDTTFLKSADLYVNPVLMLTKTTQIVYWPGYGWGGYYPGWGWGWGYYGYYSVAPNTSLNIAETTEENLSNKSSNYYNYGWGGNYYYPGWGWGGGGYTQYEYKTGTLTMEMAEGQSVRDYWNWFATHTPEEIKENPDSVPKLKLVWKAFIEGQISGDTQYDSQRSQRGFDEAFEQSYYLDK